MEATKRAALAASRLEWTAPDSRHRFAWFGEECVAELRREARGWLTTWKGEPDGFVIRNEATAKRWVRRGLCGDLRRSYRRASA